MSLFRVPTCLSQLHSSRGAMLNSRHHGCANNVCTSLCSHAVVPHLLETVHMHVSFLACVTALSSCSQCFSQQPSCWGRDTRHAARPPPSAGCAAAGLCCITHSRGQGIWRVCGLGTLAVAAVFARQEARAKPLARAASTCLCASRVTKNGDVGREAAPWACSDSF